MSLLRLLLSCVLFRHSSAHACRRSYGIMNVVQLSDAMCFVKLFDPWGVLQVMTDVTLCCVARDKC